MNTKNIIAPALALLLGLSASAREDSKPQAGEYDAASIFQDINMFTPEEEYPDFKHQAYERYGTPNGQWMLPTLSGVRITPTPAPATRTIMPCCMPS